jgi:hypothetical protein
MSTVTEVVAVIDEAEAIVEAEWIRVAGGDLSEDALIDPSDEMPKPGPRPPVAVTATARRRRPGAAPSQCTAMWPALPWPRLRVVATQRSPPLRHAAAGPFSSNLIATVEVMPLTGDHEQAATPRRGLHRGIASPRLTQS